MDLSTSSAHYSKSQENEETNEEPSLPSIVRTLDHTYARHFEECECHGLKIRVFYFLYIFQIFQMNQISFMVAQVNAVLLICWFSMRDQVRH